MQKSAYNPSNGEIVKSVTYVVAWNCKHKTVFQRCDSLKDAGEFISMYYLDYTPDCSTIVIKREVEGVDY